jgi:hypothetical protein
MRTDRHSIADENEIETADPVAPETPILTARNANGDHLSIPITDQAIDGASVTEGIDSRNGWADEDGETFTFTRAELRQHFGDAFREVMAWLVAPTRRELIARRAMVMVGLLRPELLERHLAGHYKETPPPMSAIAKADGCTKQNINALVSEFRDAFNFHSSLMRTQTARDNMRESGGGNAGKTYVKRFSAQ